MTSHSTWRDHRRPGEISPFDERNTLASHDEDTNEGWR
jgi:hypothetical protein